ncbi:MAG TPA: AAA family ATPase [Polyangiaceae bacterium]|nr:AAA family ATPase [Polyangiaceae bacterium]
MTAPPEPALSSLVPQAEALASKRHEALSAFHLLVVIGSGRAPSATLLAEFGATPRRLLDAWERHLDRGAPANFTELAAHVRDSARRFGSPTPTAPHVLLILLNDARGPARRTLDDAGVDVAGLRAAVVQLIQGLPTRAAHPPKPSLAEARREYLLSRRVTPTPAGITSAANAAPVTPAPTGVAVPYMPTEPVKPLRYQTKKSVPPAGPGTLVPLAPPLAAPSISQLLAALPPSGAVPPSGLSEREPRDDASAAPAIAAPVAAAPAATAPPHVPLTPRRIAGGNARTFALHGAPAVEEPTDARFALPKKDFPVLTGVGKNLSLLAVSADADPVVGREHEIEQALDVLAKRQGNNPCLIGPAGVGKTAVARGIAAALAAQHEGSGLAEKIVIEIPIAELVAGTGVRGALAARLQQLKKEVLAARGRVILFFDEIHLLFSGDAAEELSGELKLSLSRGELPCIGCTTTEEYRRVIERDSALARRFAPIEIDEPNREDAYLVLSSVAEKLERHHGVSYDEEAVALAIAWSMRYLPGRCLPDKAVSVIDLAGARSRRRGRQLVSPEEIAEVIAGQAGLPVERLLESDGDRMLKLEEILAERVIGHEPHIHKIARILRRNAAGLGSRRPVGTFLLLGPTGVGKTETAKAIAEVLFHSESAMTRIDMAEMSEAHAVAKLVGAPPGYVGHDAGGQLTEAVRRRPYQVLLLDEIEKAHPEVLTAFLAVFDEGRMTDSRGRLVDFKNTVIILTSNLGAGETSAVPKKRVGFSTGADVVDDGVTDRVTAVARKALPPELYNRLDEVLCFSPLTRADVRRIGRKLLGSLSAEVQGNRGISLQVSDEALELLLDAGGFDPELGARPLRRTLARRIEAPLAEAILSGQLESGDEFRVEARDGELAFRVMARERAAE